MSGTRETYPKKGYSVCKCKKGGFNVMDGLGGFVAGPYQTRSIAEGVGKRKFATPTTERPCLCCRSSFLSEGIGHRICDRCKRNNDYMARGI